MPSLSPLSPHEKAPVEQTSAGSASLRGFGVDVDFGGGETVVSVRGDVDRVTSPILGALLDGLIHWSLTPPLVLALAPLTFMDAAGLKVIAAAVNGLAGSSTGLVIRSASDVTKRMLQVTGVIDHVTMEAGAPLHVELAQVQARQERQDILDATLRLVTGLVARTVDGAQGASISLRRAGQMTTVAATDDTVVRMDDHQYETGEGPCLSAAEEGVPILVESLLEEGRWPTFIPRAMEEGITSILSSPLMVTGRPAGALNVYADASRAFTADQQELAALFAAEASGLLTGAAAAEDAAALIAVRIREALATRDLIARAEGVVMAREAVTAPEAATHLHRSARLRRRSGAGGAVLYSAVRRLAERAH